jgi:hypothetical protein
MHGLSSSASEYGPVTSSCPHGNGSAGCWSIKLQGGAFIDNMISLKEKAAGVNILSVLFTKPDSLLCADVKTCVLNSENAVRHLADVASADTHLHHVVIVQEREGS